MITIDKKYKVTEVAKKLGIARQTVYEKINKFKNELNDHITIHNNTKYISEEGIEIIKGTVNCNQFMSDSNKELSSYRQHIEDLKNIIQNYEKELLFKNKQLETKDLQIMTQSKLLENTQILLKEEQTKNTLCLESKNKSHWWNFWRKN